MRILIAIAMLVVIWSPINAQTGVRPPRGWSLSAGAGGSAFTDFQRVTVRAARLSAGGRIEEREFPRSIGAQTSGNISAAIGYWPGKNWGLRFQALLEASRFQTMVSPTDAQFAGVPESSKDSTRLPGLLIRSYHGQFIFRMPTIHARIMPYGVVGGGIVRYVVQPGDQALPPEAAADFNSGYRQRGAATVGLGAMLNMRRRGWALNFELADRIGRTPIRHSALSTRLSPTMELIPTEDRPSDPVRLASAVSFTVGLVWLLNE